MARAAALVAGAAAESGCTPSLPPPTATQQLAGRRPPVCWGGLTPLTQAYDRSLFGEEPPRPPADDGSVLLAVIVVFPKLVALVVLLVSTTVWRTRDILVLFFIFVAGLVSMSGIIALAVCEAQGDSWSVAAVKDELRSEEFTILNIDAYALRTETLFLCTRTGYRAGLLQGIAVGMAVAYVAVSAAVSGTVWVLRLCEKRRPGGEGGAFVDVRQAWGGDTRRLSTAAINAEADTLALAAAA